MEATQADLPHIRDSPDYTTTEPLDQQDIQPQLLGIPVSPEEQEDILAGNAEDPLQDVRSDSSAESYEKNGSPENVTESSSLQTTNISYTNIGKTEENQTLYFEKQSLLAMCTSSTSTHEEQNQTLYVDSSGRETEESPSKDIYNTDDCSAQNEAQYQMKDTCRIETSAAAYQSSVDVDDTSVDNQDIEEENANNEAEDKDGTRPDTTNQSRDAEKSVQNQVETTAAPDDEWIRPYAVANRQDVQTNGGQEDAYDIQPYAVAYDEQEGQDENQTTTLSSVNNSQNVCGQPNAISDTVDGKADGLLPNPMYSGNALQPNPMYSGNALQPNPMYSGNALQPNPMYSGNALRSNPMYAPNGAQPMACGGHGYVDTWSITGVVVVVLTLLTALITATFMSGENASYMGTTWTEPTYTGNTTDDVPRNVDYTTSPQSGTEENANKELKQKRIVFGGEGDELGQFDQPYAVVVSPSNEIFVADYYNRRVQVFSMTGVYLRHFPTIVSGEDSVTMEPEDISIDGEGHLWVVGVEEYEDLSLTGFIVRYTKVGHLLATLHPTFSNNSFCGIAVDSPRNLVVVTEFWDEYGEVKILNFNGSVVRKFRTEQGPEYPGLVAVGREGNLFVSDHWGETRVFVYNSTGHYLSSFGGEKIGELQAEMEVGERVVVMAIHTDSSGNVLVGTGSGGTVEMFTRDGRYVRRFSTGRSHADGVAVAQGGQLVITTSHNNTVTIFSHY
uniref:SMP-30/Gluconolactonase/LRE-like region domain-containing protein n=1 Tax=Branchiostoma floridae TaxID=7739 RepID=C3Z2H3_BRAFL|eukprot:XP_002597212.1 hypothetical protein BRAFLDRAFT_66339 [Branchiostoma floridae]